MTERVILIRHAESERNATGTIGGDPPLTEAGRAQARALAERLPTVDLAVTSGLRRTVETARLAAPAAPRLDLPELAEIGFGGYDGRSLETYREWAGSAGPEESGPGGAESRAEAARRYVQALRAVLARPEPTVLVVAHGLPVRYVLDALEGRDPRPLVDGVPPAEPLVLGAHELERAVERLGAWTAEPRW